MTLGQISTRYARALLKYADSEGVKHELYLKLSRMLEDPSAAGEAPGPVLENFVELVRQNGRLDYICQIFRTFLALYRESEGILHARLTTAAAIPGLDDRLKASLESATGLKVEMECSIDPELVGGFVLRTDELLLDASVRRRIEDIRRKFVINSNRIV